MSSLSTLPKGDSAWLLRKAIERIIQQVSVLETNIGSSTTGNSANTQIIFNDAGTLRGDSGLVFNKTTDALTVAGLVTAGSATITGDLTVDTSTLKVDSANNRVSINTTTFATDSVFAVKTTAGKFDVRAAGSLSVKLNSDQSMLYNVPTGSSHLFQINDSDAMTLNSTGLGVGVTPSAWNSSYKAIQFGSGGAVSGHTSSSLPWFVASSNAFINSAGDWKYINNGYATRYLARGDDGTQSWSTSASGSAGGTITFTQAMTLDASGNLLVGKTASSSTVVGAELRPSGAIISTLAASTNADFALYTYSTGAGAARFYVGMSGTVFATNTTISAISDQRLKENVQDIDVGLGAILALKPRKFDWKEGKGKNIKGDRGFIAQEFEQVFPQLVDEWADPSPEGEAPYKSVRQDLIPVLVKAIQELAAEVNALKNA
jgi:hypothetical protein